MSREGLGSMGCVPVGRMGWFTVHDRLPGDRLTFSVLIPLPTTMFSGVVGTGTGIKRRRIMAVPTQVLLARLARQLETVSLRLTVSQVEQAQAELGRARDLLVQIQEGAR